MQVLNVISFIILIVVTLVSIGLKIYTKHIKQDMDGFDGEITSDEKEIQNVVDWF